MRLSKYSNFIKESKEDIDSICKKYNIQNYTINEDGTVDVGRDVYLNGDNLTEFPLKFRKVNGDFDCSYNKLTNLEGAPREVVGGFSCKNNKLTSLEGSPNKVGGHFSCSFNKLTNLEGAPREVGGNFECSYNNQLTSLEGISKYISRVIYCHNNQLRDVRGIKDGWRGEVWIEVNPVHQIFRLFPNERWDEVIEFLNEYEVIRDGKIVILQALELVFHEMGLEVTEIDEIKGYQIQY
jgi:hypothetical protein